MHRFPALSNGTGCFLALLAFLIASLCAERGLALNRKPELGGPIGVGELAPGACEARARVSLWVRHQGLPLIGREVVIDASAAKIVLISATDVNNLASCDKTYFPFLPNATFSWQLLSRPQGSAATLSGGDGLAPTITPDVIGEYAVKFSACTDRICKLDQAGGVTIESYEQTVTFYADEALRPATEPTLPPLPFGGNLVMSEDEADDKCPSSLLPDAMYTPQLVAIEPWSSAADYVLVEGLDVDSRLSSTDNNLNHDVEDFITHVRVDPPFSNRIRAIQGDIETEWEWRAFPEKYRPTRGDRVSFYGYWVLDCHHTPRKTEIHPPAMSVAHRARAIRLPDSFGSNVYVPGIVSDIWVNQDGGEMTEIAPPNNAGILCGGTGLHQAGDDGACVPAALGFVANPIDRRFTFNIYLPENPKRIMEQAGFSVPAVDVPLYTAVEIPMGGPSAPIDIVENTLDGVTFLTVTVDLRDFGGSSFAARIMTAWAYPSPNNWGLRQWKMRLNSLKVHNDADGRGRGDGDWKFWVNINNTDQEWTRLINCSGCVEGGGKDHFKGVPRETGHPNPDLSLGPDLLLFPGQIIWLHASGYETDWNWEDSLDRMDEFIPQEVRSYDDEPNYCRTHGSSGCAQYTLSYDILGGSEIEGELSDESRQIYDAFVKATSGSVSPTFPDTLAPRDWNHPAQLVMERGRDPFKLSETKFVHVQSAEVHQISDISSENFRKGVERLRQQEPDVLARLMDDIRRDVDDTFRALKTEEVLADLPVLREALPADLWEQYFGDIAFPDKGGGEPAGKHPWIIAVIVLSVLVVVLIAVLYVRRVRP